MSGVREPVVKVKEAAELRGMTEGECRATLRGARFHYVNGDLVVNRADLEAALKRGIVPKVAGSAENRTADAAAFLGLDLDGSTSSENSTGPAMSEPIPDPLAPEVDPEVEKRTAQAAAALGIDLTPAKGSSDEKPVQGRQPGAPVTARADDDEGHRLGRPRRWGQL